MKKRIASSLLILLMVLTLTGCGQKVVAPETPKASKTVVDCDGRSVEIPENPERVACLYASTAHIMAMMDQQDKITGVVKGIKRDALMQKKRPNIVDVPVPFQEGSINIEELIASDTELVLMRHSTAASEGETEKLEKAGIPYVVVDYTTIDTLKTAVTVVGEVFDCGDKSSRYNAFIDTCLKTVSEGVMTLPEDEKVRVYHAVNEAARTDLKGDICTEIITIAGAVNVSAAGGSLVTEKEKTMTTLEQIYTWNPEVFLVNEATTAEYIRTDSKWSGLEAVKNDRVIGLPVGVTRWCHPGSMEPQMAALFIAKTLYPERFETVNLEALTQTYYHDYFGIDLSEEEVAAVLSGKGMRAEK